MRQYINEAITEYIGKNFSPWHMPGHKRKTSISPLFKYDFTEVPGLDDLHHPEGVIKKSEEELSKVYKTVESHYLVNGSTGGILAAVHAAVAVWQRLRKEGSSPGVFKCNDKAKVLIARNCHKSVYNAIGLIGAEPVYIYPEEMELFQDNANRHTFIYKGVTAGDVETALRNLADGKGDEPDLSGIACAVITSPTYEGFFSDVKGISEVLAKYDIPLIVDEAHGAHLPFAEDFGKSAVYSGADIVIESLHKTLPSLTQTAVIHLADTVWGRSESLQKELRKYLRVFQSSSPSYIFMSGMERCVAWCDENREEFSVFLDRVRGFRNKIETSEFKNVSLIPENALFKTDPSRLTFLVNKISGEEAAGYLMEEYGIVIEMSGSSHIVLISSVMDDEMDFNHLYEGIKGLDSYIDSRPWEETKTVSDSFYIDTDEGQFPLNGSKGKRSKDYIYVYPPGSPVIAPGDIIDSRMLEEINILKAAGKTLVKQ